MSKISRDGSATIRRAKLLLAKTELKQWSKMFLEEPSNEVFGALTHAQKHYAEIFYANQPAEVVEPLEGAETTQAI
jgi:hypothetical protein